MDAWTGTTAGTATGTTAGTTTSGAARMEAGCNGEGPVCDRASWSG
jgi:hypothetical protein